MTNAEPPEDTSEKGRDERRPNHATPYLIALVVGSLPVFVSPDAWPIPLLAMFIYLSIGLTSARKDGQVFEFADSFYYLGFALSMASLLASLEPFGPQAASPDPKSILHRFGLGMFTTLVGVAGRTVLQMFFRLPQETLEATNQRIQVEAAHFLDSLVHLRANAVSQISQMITTFKQAEKDLRDISATEHRGLDEASQALVLEKKALIEEVDGLKKSIKQATTALGRYRDAGGALTEEFGKLADAGKTLRGTIGSSSGLTPSSPTLLAAVGDLQNQFDRLRGSLVIDTESAQQSLDGFGRTVNGSVEVIKTQLAMSTEALENYSRRLAEVGIEPLERAVADLSAELSALASGINRDGETIRATSLTELHAALTQASAEASNFNVLLDQIADAVTNKVARIG